MLSQSTLFVCESTLIVIDTLVSEWLDMKKDAAFSKLDNISFLQTDITKSVEITTDAFSPFYKK